MTTTRPQRFLTINPGSTSPKLATFVVKNDHLEREYEEVIRHGVEELAPFPEVPDQYPFRKKVLLGWLKSRGLSVRDINVFVGRGGLVKPIASGVYRVNALMLEHLRGQINGAHPCNLAGLLAHGLAGESGSEEAFIVDPAIVDEMVDVARLSGLPEIERVSKVHTLNHKAVGHAYAVSIGRRYAELNLVIVHLGGGISVAAHQRGRMIDVNNGLDGEGAFTPERTGGLPTGAFMALCYSGKYTLAEMRRNIRGAGGLVGYLGTNNAREVEERVKAGDPKAELVYRAMAWQIAKDIGAYAAVLDFDVDAIILTGGMAYDADFCAWIEKKVGKVAKVVRYPGGDEEMALANGVFLGMRGERPVLEYNPE